MKIGICTNMLGTAADPMGVRLLESVEAAGFDYVELPAFLIAALGAGDFDALANRVRKLRIPCLASNSMCPPSLRLTGPDVSEKAVDDFLDLLFPRLKALGAKAVVFGSAGAKNVPEGFPMDRAFAQLVAMLSKAADRARDNGLRVAIEALNRGESNITLSLAEGAELMRAVDRPEVRMLVDYYHHAIEEEPEEAIVALGNNIIHTHFAEPKGRVLPFRQKEKYKTFFRSLRAAGYDGGVSLECYSQNPVPEMKAALAILREADRETQ